MHKIIPLALLFLSFTAAAQSADASKKPDAAKTASKAHILSVAELDQLLAQPGTTLLIDVRRPDEVSKVGGFPVYLSIQQSQLEQSLAWIPKDRILVTVSNHAGRAAKAADLLASKGFKVAGAAGAETYEQAGGKQVGRIPVPPPKADAKSTQAQAR